MRSEIELLADWMDGEGLGRGPIREWRFLAGGGQNRLVHFRRDDRDFVMRRPPVKERRRDRERVRREGHVLKALRDTAIPHPRLIGAYDGAPVLGGTFVLTERVDGFNPLAGLPPMHRSSPAMRRRMGFAAVEAIAALSDLDPDAMGLTNFLPAYSSTHQLSEFRAQLESYASFRGWPGPGSMGDVPRVIGWLQQNLPPANSPGGIVHGDYYLGNVMYRHDAPELAAIVDWEMVAIWDPLADLGRLVGTWPDEDGIVRTVSQPKPGEPHTLRIEPWDGFPTSDELISHYACCSRRDLSSLSWYIVFACFKLGVVLEEVHARTCAVPSMAEVGERVHQRVRWLFRRAIRWMK